jgi:hypothetical protein
MLMHRKKGFGGQTSKESLERETKVKHIESEPKEIMGDNNEVIQILQYLFRRQEDTTKFQQQSLEAFT